MHIQALYAMREELEKVAGSKWRAMLRSGAVTPEEFGVAAKRMQDHSGGMFASTQHLQRLAKNVAETPAAGLPSNAWKQHSLHQGLDLDQKGIGDRLQIRRASPEIATRKKRIVQDLTARDPRAQAAYNYADEMGKRRFVAAEADNAALIQDYNGALNVQRDRAKKLGDDLTQAQQQLRVAQLRLDSSKNSRMALRDHHAQQLAEVDMANAAHVDNLTQEHAHSMNALQGELTQQTAQLQDSRRNWALGAGATGLGIGGVGGALLAHGGQQPPATVAPPVRGNLEKTALNRYERALQNDEVGVQDLARTPGGATLQAHLQFGTPPPHNIMGSVSERAQFLQDSRNAMWGPGATDLTPEQLTQHRKLQTLQGNHAAKELGAHNFNIPAVGPATVLNHVAVDDNAGQFFRDLVNKDRKQVLLGTLPSAIRNPLGYQQSPQGVDSTLRHAILQHEGGEKALAHGSAHARTSKNIGLDLLRGEPKNENLALAARPISGHFGAMPLLEEKRVIWRDPEAQQVFQDARRLDPDDRYVEKLHRQFGGRPDSPIALGSPQHAEIERRVASRMPEVGAATQKRLQLAPLGMSHGIPADDAASITKGVNSLVDSKLRALPAKNPLVQRIGAWAKNRGAANVQKAVTTLSDPADLPQRLMRLRAAVRH